MTPGDPYEKTPPPTTTYAGDVRPKFRPGDIACMTPRGFSIGDSTWMCNPAAGDDFPDHGNARVVHAALAAGDMPPDQAWPANWIAIYEQWMTDGFNP